MILMDAIAGLFAIEGAVACFFMWAITSAKRKLCIPMPLYVRVGFVALGAAGIVRGVHLLWLASHPQFLAEHADPVILASWVVLAFHFTACAFSSWRRRLKPETWDILLKIGLEELRTRPK